MSFCITLLSKLNYVDIIYLPRSPNANQMGIFLISKSLQVWTRKSWLRLLSQRWP